MMTETTKYPRHNSTLSLTAAQVLAALKTPEDRATCYGVAAAIYRHYHCSVSDFTARCIFDDLREGKL